LLGVGEGPGVLVLVRVGIEVFVGGKLILVGINVVVGTMATAEGIRVGVDSPNEAVT
jgi:hypothetical protein